MAGGPINGGAFGATDADGTNAILIPTVVQITKDMLSLWTNMTCLFDPYHTPDDDKVTLPICMFHVKKIVPTRTVETSKKRVILYEPQKDGKADNKESASPVYSGVMQTVIDNAVKQPVTYNMEIIVPFQPAGRYFTDAFRGFQDIASGFAEFVGLSGYKEWLSYTSAGFSALKALSQMKDMADKLLPGTDGVSHININSLEAMADSCRVLCMKMWTGFEYKYVMITGMTYDKQPTEDDVVRATLNLQEMPVLQIFRSENKKLNTVNRGWGIVTAFEQKVLGGALEIMTGVKNATR